MILAYILQTKGYEPFKLTGIGFTSFIFTSPLAKQCLLVIIKVIHLVDLILLQHKDLYKFLQP
jgi:hypothetical protein